MEAAFIDIGKGRNAVLYAGEVNWDVARRQGRATSARSSRSLKPGQPVLVQVTKDPIGHKGARLTSQISLPGRFLVYVPDGNTSGISRKLPENERNRLKNLLKEIVPETAGVIVRTAAEGASEEELTRDVERLKALWEDIAAKVEGGGSRRLPAAVRRARPHAQGRPRPVHRGLRPSSWSSGEDAWDMVQEYVDQVAPDLVERVERHDDSERDAFAAYRIDEQIAKALDRKVWLPSGGSLVIDRTEAMTVVDVNTGKFTGSGGNLEETVTKNNLEAAEEIVRQLRLRDIGGIIVIDFIDMVLESNRDLVLRRLIECLGRDRTRHQVAEVTSLGLVQMTRKRIGTGLLEAFSEPCEACQGRGLHVHEEPVEPKRKQPTRSLAASVAAAGVARTTTRIVATTTGSRATVVGTAGTRTPRRVSGDPRLPSSRRWRGPRRTVPRRATRHRRRSPSRPTRFRRTPSSRRTRRHRRCHRRGHRRGHRRSPPTVPRRCPRTPRCPRSTRRGRSPTPPSPPQPTSRNRSSSRRPASSRRYDAWAHAGPPGRHRPCNRQKHRRRSRVPRPVSTWRVSTWPVSTGRCRRGRCRRARCRRGECRRVSGEQPAARAGEEEGLAQTVRVGKVRSDSRIKPSPVCGAPARPILTVAGGTP